MDNIYDNLANQAVELLNRVDKKWCKDCNYILYFNYKYSWEEKFRKGSALVEITKNNLFIYDNDVFEGEDTVILKGITPINETNAEPFYKV